MQVPSDRSTRWPASTSRPPNVMHGAGNSRLSRWHGTAVYGPGPSGRNSSADLPMGSGCPLRAQRLYSSTVDSSTDAGTPILSARRRSDGAILRLTNRLTDPKSRVKTMWLALPSSSWPSGRLWSGGAACTTAPRLGDHGRHQGVRGRSCSSRAPRFGGDEAGPPPGRTERPYPPKGGVDRTEAAGRRLSKCSVSDGAWTARNALKRELWATCSPVSSSKQASRCSTCGRSSLPGSCDVSEDHDPIGHRLHGNAKAPVPRTDGDRALYFTCTPRTDHLGKWLPVGLPCPVPLQRSHPELLALDLSRTILCHPLSGWPSMSTSHKRLLPRSFRIPHHQYALETSESVSYTHMTLPT